MYLNTHDYIKIMMAWYVTHGEFKFNILYGMNSYIGNHVYVCVFLYVNVTCGAF